MSSDVFVTGVGIVSPAGNSAESTWQTLIAGERCIGPLDHADLAGCRTRFGGQISSFIPAVGTELLSRINQLAVYSSTECLRLFNSYEKYNNHNKSKHLYISYGSSKGNIVHIYTSIKERLNMLLGIYIFDNTPDTSAAAIASQFGEFTGIHVSVGACATGAMAVIRGTQMIHDGDADGVLCGGADASLHPLWVGCFEQMGLLAQPHPDLGPAWACRPFDRTRSGFVLGEGAGALFLESEKTVLNRGVQPLCRIAGYACGTDPSGMTQMATNGEILAKVIELALGRAGFAPHQIVCIHAHGTGTTVNDLVEARAIHQVFGKDASRIPLVSLKGTIGHLFGGAGAVELAVSALACREQRSPGNATLIEPDPELGPLDLPTKSFEIPRGPILKISIGFGGHLAAIILTQA